MSEYFMPVMNLSNFDAFEFRVRVMDHRSWITNVACKGDTDGEMFQALFYGTPNEWSSVIIPFSKYLFTSRGMLVEQQQDFDTTKIHTLGFLQAERKEGEFCIQIESIRALSLEILSSDIRYDPKRNISGQSAECPHTKEDTNFDICQHGKTKKYYKNLFKY